MEKLQAELKRIDQFIDDLSMIAGSEINISEDKQLLLDEIMNDISDYRFLVLDILDSGKISDEDKQRMKKFRDDLFTKVTSFTLIDGEISETEKEILDPLIKFVKHKYNE